MKSQPTFPERCKHLPQKFIVIKTWKRLNFTSRCLKWRVWLRLQIWSGAFQQLIVPHKQLWCCCIFTVEKCHSCNLFYTNKSVACLCILHFVFLNYWEQLCHCLQLTWTVGGGGWGMFLLLSVPWWKPSSPLPSPSPGSTSITEFSPATSLGPDGRVLAPPPHTGLPPLAARLF